jgi:hypothetical protein
MSTIDRQRIGAVRSLEALGYTFDGFQWHEPGSGSPVTHEDADAMHALLVLRADKLTGCTEGSEEELELKLIAETVGAYETKRWPDGVVPRGKG